jgi:hypothetical protein
MNLERNSDLQRVRDRGKKCEQQRYRDNPRSWPAATSARVEATDGTLGLGAGMNFDRNSDLQSMGSRGKSVSTGGTGRTQEAGLLPLQLGWSRLTTHWGWALVYTWKGTQTCKVWAAEARM